MTGVIILSLKKKDPVAKVFLIDGSSYFFRAYYAIRPLSTSKGLPTNAIFGFINMILKVVREQRPDYLAVIFDSREPSFRKEKFEQYKANREQMPLDLAVQIPYMDKVLQAFRIKSFQQAGFEADDLIATLAKRLELKGFDVVIVTGDKDMMQLVSS